MKNLSTIENNIAKTLKLSSDGITNHSGQSDIDFFIRSAKRYIKAIKQGRVICNIESVSASGMSRNLKFLECNGSIKSGFYYQNFFKLFKDLGFKTPINSNAFKISGCGMDMVFHTNYTIIHQLHRLGFITKKECSILAQKTPTVI
tara:strand:- start:464 stop:901 length:438 start_codon:yes stop_codon:yes gene_type:complete